VVLDVLLDRQPFRDTAAQLVAKVERKELTGVLGATTLTTLYYLVAKVLGKDAARSAVRDVLSLFEIAPVDKTVLSQAIDSPLGDFEDAVLMESGAMTGIDAVVTRDPNGFRGGRLQVFSPQELNAAAGSLR
jgi:predicted nucleic acid-binding protein